MFTIAPERTLLRQFNRQFDRLFAQGITKQCARSRRTRMGNNAAYQAHAFLAKALKKLRKDQFEHMIVFLGWENVDCTNNHPTVRSFFSGLRKFQGLGFFALRRSSRLMAKLIADLPAWYQVTEGSAIKLQHRYLSED